MTAFTTLNYLSVRYFAVDPGFPYQLVTFDTMPVNYSKGLLTNISSTALSSYYVN